MTAYPFDKEAATRRLDAYVDMLKAAYQVDDYGLADMLGINRGTWTKFMRADLMDKGGVTIVELARITDISIGWLLAEDTLESE